MRSINQTTQILTLSDAGRAPAQIAAALTLPVGTVYATLRRERPDRKRAQRTRTSLLPAKVLGLHQAGVKVARIAKLLGVSRAYCYRLLQDG